MATTIGHSRPIDPWISAHVPEFQRFERQVFLPFLSLIALSLCVLFALELWSATEANYLAAESSRKLAQAGLEHTVRQVGTNLTATATWDDAVENAHLSYDHEWTVANIGEWATDALHFEMTFIVDPDGNTQFAMVNGSITTTPVESALEDGLLPLLQSVRANPLGKAATGIVRSGNVIAIVGAAAIRPHTKKLAPITGSHSILIYAESLDVGAIESFRDAYLLDGLVLLPQEPINVAGVLPLLDASGSPLGYFAWEPAQPGTRMLQVVLPILAALSGMIAFFSILIILHARRAAAAMLLSRRMALTDSLTGLPNRMLLEDRLQEAIKWLERNVGTVAVLCLDLDGFKRVNDLRGHGQGDEVLREVARRFRTVLRTADIVARVGGDEFVVVQAAPDQQAVERLAIRLLEALTAPILLTEAAVVVGASIGISFATEANETGADLLRRADIALYDAKREGGNRYRVAHLPAKNNVVINISDADVVTP